MIIGFNALYLVPNGVGGTEYYLRSIIKELINQDKNNSYIIFCNKENYQTFFFEEKNIKKVLVPIAAKNKFLRIIHEYIFFPKLVEKNNCDILYSFGYSGPFWGNFKKIITVFDVNWKDYPEDNSLLTNFVLNFLISSSIKRSNLIITTSEFSKKRLSFYFPRYKNKMKVIWAAVDKNFIKFLKGNLKKPIKNKYILCVTAFYPHKKALYLLDLWKRFNKDNRNRIKLVIIGKLGKDLKIFEQKVSKLSNILWIKKASLKELVSFYKHSELVIQPSIYEGFGYPAYEALASDKNVLVGKKDFYNDSILNYIDELSFNLDSDNELLKKSLLKKTKSRKDIYNQSYDISAKKIISLFEEI
jgi:hypothetical protein